MSESVSQDWSAGFTVYEGKVGKVVMLYPKSDLWQTI